VRVKIRKINGILEVFKEKERVIYEIYDMKGKVKVKIKLQRGKSEDN
jgi:hypothetical protein